MEKVIIVHWGNIAFIINQVIKWNLPMIALEMESFHFAEWMNGNCLCNILSKDAGRWWDLIYVSESSAQIKENILEAFLESVPGFPCISCFPIGYVTFADKCHCWDARTLEVTFVMGIYPFLQWMSLPNINWFLTSFFLCSFSPLSTHFKPFYNSAV